MSRDVRELRRNLMSVCPTLTPDQIGLVIECLGYELLGRGIYQGHALVNVSRELLGWAPSPAAARAELGNLPLRQPA
jgi:hypothetical protein